jgi:hypothetical protein
VASSPCEQKAPVRLPAPRNRAREMQPVQSTCAQIKSYLTQKAWMWHANKQMLDRINLMGEACLYPSSAGSIVMRRLRVTMWSSAILAIAFQAAFLFELHSPQAMDETLWSLFAVSVVCFIVFVYARSAISSLKRYRG